MLVAMLGALELPDSSYGAPHMHAHGVCVCAWGDDEGRPSMRGGGGMRGDRRAASLTPLRLLRGGGDVAEMRGDVRDATAAGVGQGGRPHARRGMPPLAPWSGDGYYAPGEAAAWCMQAGLTSIGGRRGASARGATADRAYLETQRAA